MLLGVSVSHARKLPAHRRGNRHFIRVSLIAAAVPALVIDRIRILDGASSLWRKPDNIVISILTMRTRDSYSQYFTYSDVIDRQLKKKMQKFTYPSLQILKSLSSIILISYDTKLI